MIYMPKVWCFCSKSANCNAAPIGGIGVLFPILSVLFIFYEVIMGLDGPRRSIVDATSATTSVFLQKKAGLSTARYNFVFYE